MEKVMEFETIGFWSFTNVLMEPSRKALLYSMNLFNQYLPGGYGIAIIILTLLIRILFWPLTHKSTESMKRMQIQPELKASSGKIQKRSTTHATRDHEAIQRKTREPHGRMFTHVYPNSGFSLPSLPYFAMPLNYASLASYGSKISVLLKTSLLEVFPLLAH